MDPGREPTYAKRALALEHAATFARRTAESYPEGSPARSQWFAVVNELRTEIRALNRADLDWWADYAPTD